MDHTNPYSELDSRIVGDLYTSMEAMDNLIVLCDRFGSRFGGTEGERQAAQWMVEKMQGYGLRNVRLEPVPFKAWIRGDARLEVVSPVERNIPCISLPHSPAGELTGRLVDMGDGAPEDFDLRAEEIHGNIVMTTSVVNPKGANRWIHRNEKYGRSLLAGATGFIFVNHYPAYGPATGSIGRNQLAPIPGVAVCYEDGAAIRRLAKQHGQIQFRLTTTDSSQPKTSWNVLGDLPGREEPERSVLVGCHYDGHDISQGAGDPASGVAALLEAARVLASHAPPLRCTVRFALWGVEEIGLLGSQAYAAAHAVDLPTIRFYLNMDAAGARDMRRDLVLNEWPVLEPLFERWREEMAATFEVGQSVNAHSDHYPFFLAGVPTGGIQSAGRSLEGRGYGHTQYDTVDKVDLADMREAAALAARLLLRMAAEEHWPATQRTAGAVQELLDSPAYREEKALQDRLAAHFG